MPILLDLFLTFAKVGLFTFGGGYAMISLIEDTCVRKKQWITHEDMMNVTVIAESTPGPIAINCATFVGYKQKGLPGAVMATLGMILPSFLVILLISTFLEHFLEIAWIANAFKGIRIAVGILILDAALKMIRKMPKKENAAGHHDLCCCFDAIGEPVFMGSFQHHHHACGRSGQPVTLHHGQSLNKRRCPEMMLLELFLGFLRVGCFAFGGAYGAIPLIRDVVLSYGWLEDDMLTTMIAVSESTPGPIMVNLATYIGNVQAGFIGALISTLAVVLPSFVIILLIMILLKTALKNSYVQAVLRGLKPCIIGIILATGLYMVFRSCFGSIRSIAIDWTVIVLTAALGAIYFGSRKVLKNGISPIGLIAVSAVAGILVYGV